MTQFPELTRGTDLTKKTFPAYPLIKKGLPRHDIRYQITPFFTLGFAQWQALYRRSGGTYCDR